jgi:hypothetical protein
LHSLDLLVTQKDMATVTISDTMQAINRACRGRGGKYAGYSCQVVSWDDVSRGTLGGSLSCWGANITDTYLKSKHGEQLFTVRPDNWNEKLGKVASSEVALVAGNHVAGGHEPLFPVTLRDFLKAIESYGRYAGLEPGTELSNEELDRECSIRFQTTFLPVVGERGTLEFATEAYNYNTTSDEDPRNLVLLCTSQGVAVQQDGAGAKRLFHHATDMDGAIHRYWLEAEQSTHKVGGAQRETAEEREDALRRGKATASVIGTRAMGTRFNVLMTIQVPLEQKKPPERPGIGGGFLDMSDEDSDCDFEEMCCAEGAMDEGGYSDGDFSAPAAAAATSSMSMYRAAKPSPPTGTANAARVSRGSEFDVWPGLSTSSPKRHPGEHVTLTVVIYNTVTGGVPSEADVMAAIDDLENLYEQCGAHGRLADATFDFMKKDLLAQDMADITDKVTTQPPPAAVASFDVFPS